MSDTTAQERAERIVHTKLAHLAKISVENWAEDDTAVGGQAAHLVLQLIEAGLLIEDDADPEFDIPTVTDHPFMGVEGAPDDDECTNRSDGTDDTYCSEPESEHEWSTR